MKRAPTLNDVARVAKVSRSLASLVFQDSPKVSEKSRAAVLKAAEKLGYQPNESARRLKSSVTRTIGMVLTDVHNTYYGQIFYGVENAASALDYKLLIGNSGSDPDPKNPALRKLGARQLETLKTIRGQMVDGIICSSPQTTPEELRAAAKNSPLVLIGHTASVLQNQFDVVSSDERDAAKQIVDHLTELGHKRISHISGGPEEGPSTRAKLFMSEMKKRGLSDEAKVYVGSWSQEAGYKFTEQILSEKKIPTAIYAANDLIAMGVLAKLKEANLRVPEDISVLSYDDSVLASLHLTNLTSMKEPLFEMGHAGFELLIKRIEGNEKNAPLQHIKIIPKLIVRSSTGRSKSNK
jgi:DNA-binding LacI/PurR family transcriptional regulator